MIKCKVCRGWNEQKVLNVIKKLALKYSKWLRWRIDCSCFAAIDFEVEKICIVHATWYESKYSMGKLWIMQKGSMGGAIASDYF